ncbi:hypothetical protein LG047_02460 [Methylocystis sp. WRRC1]|uniref:hypothetical protein n=1 Tax=Methylocystis sp. WRRC1 TaxID=1732014 RepID=UPI001D133209|nr:hypothetical protein [Methylocystis sp. WRRC1]MCC3244194.1 hypothetical protein [Methylocystis sp. WRRC1]
MKDDDHIPTIGEHRGVPLHDFQDEARLAVVRGDIDAVDAMTDWRELWRVVTERRLAPEASLYAEAKLRVLYASAATARVARPDIDLEMLSAYTAGLNSFQWIDPAYYGSVLQNVRPPGDDSLTPRPPESRAAIEAEEDRRHAVDKAKYEAARAAQTQARK